MNSETKFLFISNDESVASVDKDGNVLGVSKGSTTITCYLETDLKVFGQVTINVYLDDAISSLDVTKELEFTSLPSKTTFTQGTYFEVPDMVVSLITKDKDGKQISKQEVKDYTINPALGSLLSEVGDFKAVISYEDATSISFDYKVVEAPLDDSLSTILIKFEDADSYTVKVSGQVRSNSGLYKIETATSFTNNALYTTNGNTSFGYAYQSSKIAATDTTKEHLRGVFKYTLDDKKNVVPDSYINHDTWSKYINGKDFKYFDPDLAPKRSLDGYFSYASSTLNTSLLAYLGLESISNYVSSVKVKVLSDTSFETNLTLVSSLGKITYTVEDIDSTSLLTEITTYLNDKKGGKEVDEQIIKVQQAVLKNNYTVSLGKYDTGFLGMTIDIGVCYYTTNYIYFDYTQDYISYVNSNLQEGQTPISDYGVLVKDGVGYNFTVTNQDGKDILVVGSQLEQDFNSTTLAEEYAYPSTAVAFKDSYLDTYPLTDVNGVSTYLSLDATVTKNFGTLIGQDTATYIPYGLGFNQIKVDELTSEVTSVNLVYVFTYGGSNYILNTTLLDIGKTTNALVEEYLNAK